jgi:peptidoglycan/LPS O-acetylase OafA/YrhL
VLTRASRLPAPLAVGLSQSHLPSLDGLRAVAALAVVFYHYGFDWAPGGLGVLAFFVLSGFLITWLLLKEEERFGAISLKLFYMRRSLRIFPAFYAYWLLLVGALILFHKRLIGGQTLASFFYFNNYYQALHGDPNTGLSHTWSLAIEEQFYLLWPLLFLLLRRNRHRIVFLLAAIATVWAWREALVFVIHRNQGYIYEAFDTRADHLMIGCLLAIVLREGALREGSTTWLWERLVVLPLLLWVTLALLALSTALNVRFGTNYRDTVGFVIDPILIAVLIVQAIAWPQTGFARLLNCAPMRYLGTISYSIYLYQQMLIDPSKKFAEHWPALSLPLSVAAVLLAASASYWIVERPFLRLKNSFERNRRPVSQAASAPLMA